MLTWLHWCGRTGVLLAAEPCDSQTVKQALGKRLSLKVTILQEPQSDTVGHVVPPPPPKVLHPDRLYPMELLANEPEYTARLFTLLDLDDEVRVCCGVM